MMKERVIKRGPNWIRYNWQTSTWLSVKLCSWSGTSKPKASELDASGSVS